MIGIFRSQGPGTQGDTYSWAVAQATSTAFNIYCAGASPTNKSGTFVANYPDGFPDFWIGSLMPATNTFEILYRNTFSGFNQQNLLATVTCAGSWGNTNATYSIAVNELPNDVLLIDYAPVQMIHLASGGLLVAMYYRFDLDPTPAREYKFIYRAPNGTWQAALSTTLPLVDSLGIVPSTAMIQHADGSVYFFRHLAGDTAIGMIRLIETTGAGGSGTIAVDGTNSTATFVNAGSAYPPQHGTGPAPTSPQLRASLYTVDASHKGLVLAYQTSVGATTLNRSPIALCLVSDAGVKSFAAGPSMYAPNAGGFEIGGMNDIAFKYIWFAGQTLDTSGVTTPVKVSVLDLSNSTWTNFDTNFYTAGTTQDIYPVRDEFGSSYGGGFVSGFGWLSAGVLTFQGFSAYQPTPTGPDTTVPSAVFVTPLQGATVSGVVPVRATCTDNVGISEVHLYINDQGTWRAFPGFQTTGYSGSPVNIVTSIDTTPYGAQPSGMLCRCSDPTGNWSYYLNGINNIGITLNNVNSDPGNVAFFNEIVRVSAGNLYSTGLQVKADSQKNIIVVGNYNADAVFFGDGSVSGFGGFIAKYSPAGNLLWKKTYPVGSAAVCIDSSDNIYVTGGFAGTINLTGVVPVNHALDLTSTVTTQTDVFVAKYDSNGVHQWSISMGGQYGGNVGAAIAVDSGGNVLVGGYFYYKCNFGGGVVNGYGTFDGFLVKLNNAGGYIWDVHMGGSQADYLTGIAVDTTGATVVVGYGYAPINFGVGDVSGSSNYEAFIAKYSSVGALVWAKVLGNTANDTAKSVGIGPNNEVFVTGVYTTSINFGNTAQGVNVTLTALHPDWMGAYIAHFSSNGVIIKARAINVQADGSNFNVTGLAVDATGMVTITGTATGQIDFGNNVLTAGDTNIFLAKYDSADPSFRYKWHKRSSNTAQCAAYAIGLDSDRSVLGVGYAQGNVTIDAFQISTPNIQTKSAYLIKIVENNP